MRTPTARSPSKITSRTRTPFARIDAVLAGVVEHHLVELAAQHLPGLRAFVRVVVGEIERLGDPAVLADELHGASS